MLTKDKLLLGGFKSYVGTDPFKESSLEKELELCQKMGLNADKLRKFNYNALQLSEIRKGLMAKVDINKYINPKLSWMEMEEIRLELTQGIDMEPYRQAGFNNQQIFQIRKGLAENIDVSVYAKKTFIAEQMKQIRKGLAFSKDFPIIFYLDPAFDGLQMKEIRLGLQAQIDVSNYAHVNMPYMKMRVIRESAQDGLFFTDKQIHLYNYGVLDQIHKAFCDNVDLTSYIMQKYDAEQLEEIRLSLLEDLPIHDYISVDMRGDAIREIRLGLEHGILVDQYASADYNWQQMHEMRLGLEHQIDITPYCKPLYWADQMRELRMGLEEGLDISSFASMMYTAKDMHRIRIAITFGGESEAAIDEIELGDEYSQEAKATILSMLDNKSKFFSLTHKSMLCYITLPKENNLSKYTKEVIIGFLKKCGVRHGIDEAAIEQMTENPTPGEKYLVAFGSDAVNGRDGYYEFFFESSGSCELTEDEEGQVDFSRLDDIVKVNVGDKVAVYHKSTKGVDGQDVFGRKISSKNGKEIPILSGDGFMVLNDRVTYVAKYKGALTIVNGNVYIQKIMILPEVKLTDKTIRYDGTILVTGDVNSGSEIIAQGDVIISGYMESSTIKSGGNVSIKSGAKCPVRGGIEAKGNVSAKYFEGVKIEAKNVYANSFVNCNIKARGEVKTYGNDGVIHGGTVQALSYISTANAGSKGFVKTIISLGVIDRLINEYTKTEKALDREKEDLKTLEAEKERLQELGAVTKEMMKWKIKINAAANIKAKAVQDLTLKLAAMEETINQGYHSKAVITHTVFPNVLFVVCGVSHRNENLQRLQRPMTIKTDSKHQHIVID